MTSIGEVRDKNNRIVVRVYNQQNLVPMVKNRIKIYLLVVLWNQNKLLIQMILLFQYNEN